MIDESNFHVYFAPFAGDVKALAALGPDGFCSIYVNSNIPFEEQQKAVRHELRHILHNDFYNDLPIDAVEEGR